MNIIKFSFLVRVIVVFALILMTQGCATSFQDKSVLRTISSIQISENVEMPKSPTVGGALVFGKHNPEAIGRGANILEKTLEYKGVNFKDLLISISKEKFADFSNRLSSNKNGGVGLVEFHVVEYGFVKGWYYTFRPQITIRALMFVDKKLAFDRSFSVGGYTETYAAPLGGDLPSSEYIKVFSSGIETILNEMQKSLQQAL
ncbi:hypothetical protein RF679_02510 [Undibacterium cyanobacteriorum]|uniref:Lipoprotein n=1 Tax=Undibacterium cyanobacteriorum TaxID=3073561 RepID=A0ABY9RIW6_9BURK|nr:hypothetical protein [Undibacterium sp. 20NA77.5]WMW81168.1 hypothetical protein RF679_02510 [Undibacterium sp. 20NA77.5]